ncbi:hypothetical protein NDA11_001603 [Ustilago hordei]|uniref:Auxin resistance protein n=1 Tax=Ustilago hordei TaxID=120017 RepID=Q2A771_USTHO|nr:hypothetical protein NDA10_002832 [Ustilago hordei]KAJ1570593.1 hypothetical protein NDA11_001603 [Ustilago hordei]KAJ1587368.1 hypothetical protein NDA15_004922 [Ustilago hordei]KAJ1589837.1 hypothetical protein NDA12_001497 [Ustilago hordei]UTT96693.1 hypothetical protein NDA17_006217 [Ustilago hordei]
MRAEVHDRQAEMEEERCIATMDMAAVVLPPELRRIILWVFTTKHSPQLHLSAIGFITSTLAQHGNQNIDTGPSDVVTAAVLEKVYSRLVVASSANNSDSSESDHNDVETPDAVAIAKETRKMLQHRAHLTAIPVNDAPPLEKDGKQYIAAKGASNAILKLQNVYRTRALQDLAQFKQLVGEICKSASVEGKIADDEAEGFVKHAECLKLIHRQHLILIAVGRVSYPTMKLFVKLLDDRDGQQDSKVIYVLEIVGKEHVIIRISCWLVMCMTTS